MKPRTLTLVAVAASTALVAAACGKKKQHDPVNYSAPVGITLNVKSGDVVAGVIDENKNINTESGNPFGAFVNSAKAALGGHDPSSVALESLTLSITSNGTGVTSLAQLFTGPVTISFQMNGGTGLYPAATANNPTGTNAAFTEIFDSTDLPDADYAQFLGGQFKVLLHGSAATAIQTTSFNVDLVSTFVFSAFQ